MIDGKSRRHEERADLKKRQKTGISSFVLYDAELVFKRTGLGKGDTFLDLGCGAGDHSLKASGIVGNTGKVYALDKWSETINALLEKSALREMRNIEGKRTDITGLLPVGDNNIDVCLLATVLHIPEVAGSAKTLFPEIRRVLKPAGRLAVIEIKKEKTCFGPPQGMRLSPDEVVTMAAPYGFSKTGLTDLGDFYMVQLGVRGT